MKNWSITGKILLVLGLVSLVLVIINFNKISKNIGLNTSERTFAACDKFNSECKGVSAQSWINNRCDVLWNSCIGTWGRIK